MIKCKDVDGKILDSSYRNDYTNAIVFAPNDKYKYYLKEKENKEKMIQMENKINELMCIVSDLIKNSY